MSSKNIPITPEVLVWARERAGMTLEDARLRFRDIAAWESGESSPTYCQLEKLGEAFQIPIAVFFFPEPPDVPPIRESFRTLPDAQFEQLPPAILALLRKAKVFQMNLSELSDGRNPAERLILRDLRFTSRTDVVSMARRVRKYLRVSLDEQTGWLDAETAVDAWRSVLEDCGVAVFKDTFHNDNYSGFSLYDETFPIIYVNNSAKTRQTFTLFHEVAHLLFHTSGIVSLSEMSEEGIPMSSQQTEIICNRFAAEFLLPGERFEQEIRDRAANERTAEYLAGKYHVSREVIFRRFLDQGLITKSQYDSAQKKWARQWRHKSGGNYYWTKVAYLGARYIGLAFSKYHQNRISEPELADYLDVKVSNLPKLEDYFFRKAA
ncbi:MAG: XRE family transcriptional regulator [Gammaproteobacteria bacterium]|nr:XRE family transcriptional regulator [Gammaproteobacteria bacterium]